MYTLQPGEYEEYFPVGAHIDEVASDSPAEKAGLQVGDVITKINGETLTVDTSPGDVIYKCKPGDEISLVIFRDNKYIEISVVLGEKK